MEKSRMIKEFLPWSTGQILQQLTQTGYSGEKKMLGVVGIDDEFLTYTVGSRCLL